ncbi:MAG TPA: ATP-binding protein, partial [Blastocatellia bacterium]|nr:ATP-binding protein [Blastocatellia bacterium]
LSQLAGARPEAIYTKQDGLSGNYTLRLFEDSRSDIWISTVGDGQGLSRWDRRTGAFRNYTEHDGLPPMKNVYPTAFCEDRGGNVWIGLSVGGGLLRYRNGQFDLFGPAEGLPDGGIFNLFVDSAGGLWVPTTRGGVMRIDNPAAERPVGHLYTSASGISSNDVRCVTEDIFGRIYFGTGRGIDRLDPANGTLRHYSGADGVLTGDILAAQRDRDGSLWFGSASGLMRLIPKPDLPSLQPAIWITGLRIAGSAYPISAIGESQVGPVTLAPGKNNIQLSFVGLGLGDKEDLKYEYKIDNAKQNWSQPTDLRTLNFADLAPGKYQLLVRAITADGAISDTPARFTFRILPPLWQRWWFSVIAAVFFAGILYGWYRYRVTQLLQIAQVRARISGDLHDDIGANLSRIAILSEVAHQQMASKAGDADSTLSSIADISRESMASMRDIVWAVNPNRDRLLDLIQRMRGFASDVFASQDIEFEFDGPGNDVAPKLGPDIRRDVFLIFKEAVNNAVRHSGCTRASIRAGVERGWLVLDVSDNGARLNSENGSDGHGLSGMRRRAQNLGGDVEVVSGPGQGTTVRFRAPIRRRNRWPLLRRLSKRISRAS